MTISQDAVTSIARIVEVECQEWKEWCYARGSEKMTEKELNFAIESGIIDVATIQAQYAMNERNKILQNHNYNIWKGKDGYFCTYVPDKYRANGRKQIKRKHRSDLEDAIFEYYKNVGTFDVFRLFNSWNDYRYEIGKIGAASYSKNKYVYNRHFKPYSNVNVENIKEEDITEFIEREVCSKHLKYKAYLNLRGMVKGMCKYAKRKRIVNIDIERALEDVELSDRDFDKTRRKDPSMEVFNEDELPIVLDFLTNNLDDIRDVAILLILVSGLRIGEICTLKYEDWDSDVSFTVNRTETKYKNKDGKVIYDVKPTPKTAAGIRNVVIPTKYAYIHELLLCRKLSEFCFADREGEFIKDYVIRKRFYRICDILGMPRRSPHDGRRTYATALLNNGVDEMFIKDQMGHTDVNTTKQYYYRNVRNIDSKLRIVDNAII